MKQYLELLRTIKEKGTYKNPARENMPGTLSLFGHQMRFDLSEGFPLITTKKVSFKNIVVELLSFLRGDETIEYLQNNGCNIWNEDVEKFDPIDKIHWHKQYPYLWRNWEGELSRRKRDKTPFMLYDKISKIENSEFIEIYKTKRYGCFKILKKTKDKRGNKTCEIQFLDTGYKTIIRESRLHLDIYDPYAPSFCDVACLGLPEQLNFTDRLKIVWKGLIQRCYDENKSNYKYYGGRGINVSNRWKCFEYFQDDVQSLLNWENKLNNWNEYELDKDIKGGNEYSAKTCIWITQSDNKRQKVLGYKYTVRNIKTKDIESFEISKDFINKYKLNQGNFNSMLRGERASAQDWILVNKEKTNKGVDQIKELIEGLKNNPMSRRHIITAWNPATLDDMALNACHCLVQFNCRILTNVQRENIFYNLYKGIVLQDAEMLDENNIPKYYLDCQMYQRSADVFLGVPYNIASYALLTEILCKICNFIPGEFIHTFGDAHIYENHMDQVKEQLARVPTKLPKLEISETANLILQGNKNLDEKIKFLSISDFELEEYNPHPRIKAKLSTGLK